MTPLRLMSSAMACIAIACGTSALAATAPLDVNALAAAGPYQVVVVHSPLDEDLTDELVLSTGAAAIGGVTGAAITTAGMAGSATSMTIGSTTYYSTAATIAAPVAVLIGAGTFAGAIQQQRAERRDAQRFAVPVQQRAETAHVEHQFDQKLADTVTATLAEVAWLKRAGPVTTLHVTEDPWAAAHAVPKAAGARSLLVISVAARLPDSLAGYYRSLEVRLYSGQLQRTRGNFSFSKYGRYAWSSGESVLVTSPVPLADIGHKPQAWIDARSAEVRAEFDARIAATRNRDTQRELRTRRNAALDRVAGPWRIAQLAEYMAEKWSPPEGDRYAELVRDGQQALAAQIASAVASVTTPETMAVPAPDADGEGLRAAD